LLKANFSNVRTSAMEDFIGRGNRRIGAVIRKAWEAGATNDSWWEAEDVAFAAWSRAIEESGLGWKYREVRRLKRNPRSIALSHPPQHARAQAHTHAHTHTHTHTHTSHTPANGEVRGCNEIVDVHTKCSPPHERALHTSRELGVLCHDSLSGWSLAVQDAPWPSMNRNLQDGCKYHPHSPQ
jgi:hypothetical protein